MQVSTLDSASTRASVVEPREILSPQEIALLVLGGLARHHFGVRLKGRPPKTNSEFLRLKRGLRDLILASGLSITPDQELALLTQLANHSLFSLEN